VGYPIFDFLYYVGMRAFAVFIIGLLVGEAARWFFLRRKRKQSLSWPMAEARAEKGHIAESNQVDEGTLWTLNVPYSYSIEESRYTGWYAETFGSLELAQAARLTLPERRLIVRYNPENHADSFMDLYRDF
jgi:hypothetical protein